MGKARVLILGHSFIRRLHAFITRSHDNEYTTKLGISTPDFICKWHGVGGRTVAKVLKYDLSVVKEFGPDIIILQLGTNDLVNSSPLTVGSSLEHLGRVFYSQFWNENGQNVKYARFSIPHSYSGMDRTPFHPFCSQGQNEQNVANENPRWRTAR